MAKAPSKTNAPEEKTSELQPTASTPRAMHPFEEMERLFDTMWPRLWQRPSRWEWPTWASNVMPFEGKVPKVDIIERDEAIVVRAEVPGVDKKDLDVAMTENTVTIKGSTSHEEKEEKGEYFRCEMSRGSFSRTVALPAEVDGAKAKATFKDGLLELTVPKVTKSKRRSVKVE